MKLFTATQKTQGTQPGDFSWCEPGEIVYPGFQCCNSATCGCDRSLVGHTTHKATTTFEVTECKLRMTDLAKLVYDSYQASGWTTVTKTDALKLAKEMKRLASPFEVGDVCGLDRSVIRRRTA